MSETPVPSNDKPWLKPWVALCAIPCLLGLSALLAHYVTFRHLTWSTPIVVAVLVRDALPWFLQFAAIALLLVLVNRSLIRATRPQVKVALILPFGMGLLYWIWTIVKFLPNATALDVVSDRVLEGMTRQLGVFRLEDTLYQFNSLLVSPLHASGWLIDMQDWGFVRAGLSTLLVTGYWLFAAKWIGFSDRGPKIGSVKQWVRLLLAMLVYFLPVFIDSAFYLLRLVREIQR